MTVINLSLRRLRQRILEMRYGVFHESGRILVHIDGRRVMDMDPKTARAWAKAFEQNADAAESGRNCECAECLVRFPRQATGGAGGGEPQ